MLLTGGGIAICDGQDYHKVPLDLPSSTNRLLNDNQISRLPGREILNMGTPYGSLPVGAQLASVALSDARVAP